MGKRKFPSWDSLWRAYMEARRTGQPLTTHVERMIAFHRASKARRLPLPGWLEEVALTCRVG